VAAKCAIHHATIVWTPMKENKTLLEDCVIKIVRALSYQQKFSDLRILKKNFRNF
jgi:hypothetical protein